MKTAGLGIALLAGALGVAGCVTEGEVRPEPASDEEQLEVNLALGVGYIQENRPDLAIDALQRAIGVDPRSADAQSTIAVAYDLQGDGDLAEEHHRRAVQLAPRDADTQHRYAVFLCREGRWDDADIYFQRAVDASARNASLQILRNAADCARGAGDLDGAERNLRAILDIDAVNVAALRGMLDVSIRTSNYISARAFWQRLERSGPLLGEDVLACFIVERELGDASAAEACADRLRRDFPGSPAARQLGELERNAG
jgi:type IV pilus assembly protein PilF